MVGRDSGVAWGVTARGVAALAMGATLLGTLDAAADQADEAAATHDRWQASASFQRGFEIKPDRNDPLGWALGADVGSTLDGDLYLGAEFDHFFGHHSGGPGLDLHFRLDYLAVVAGRDVVLGRDWTLRPFVETGAVFRHRDCTGDFCGGYGPSETLAASLGVDLIYLFGPLLCAPRIRSDFYFWDSGMVPAIVLGVRVGAAW